MNSEADDLIRRAAEHGLFDGTDSVAPSRPEPPAPKCVADRYELVAEIGRGGFGAVWRARDRTLGREVALKLLKINEPEEVARFELEARVAAKLRHAHVVSVHDVGTHDGRPYLVMDLIDGKPMSALIATLGADPLGRILAKAARGLGAAHASGVVHRDVKPGNILVDACGEPFVTDFGLAKPLAGDSGVKTVTGAIMGTPMYMAPEQAAGELQRISPRSDVFSLGVVLYEILTKRNPFLAHNVHQILDRVQKYDPPPPSRRGKRVPVELDWVCLKALEKDPARRYADANEFAEDLDRFYRGETVTARPASLLYRAAKRVRRNPWAWGMGAAGLLAVGLGSLVAWMISLKLASERETVLAQMRQITDAKLELALEKRRAGKLGEMREQVAEMDAWCALAAGRAPELAEPDYRRGRMRRAVMEFGEAEKWQELALAKESDYAPARYERALLLSRKYRARLKELEEAELRAEGQRLSQAGALEPGRFAGQEVHRRGREEWERDDAQLRALKARIVDDLRALRVAEGLDPAWRPCAEGILAMYERRWEEGEEKLNVAISTQRYLEEAYEALAEGALARGRYEEAIEWSRKGEREDRGYLPHVMNGAMARVNWGNYKKRRGEDPGELYATAIADYDRALGLNPTFAEALMSRADARLNWANYKQRCGEDPGELYAAAIADYDRALGLNSTSAEALMNRAAARGSWGVYKETRGEDPSELYAAAIADFDRALGVNPDSADALQGRASARVNWGGSSMNRGEDPGELYAAAIADFDRALGLNPTYDEALMSRANARLNWGVFEESRGKDPGELYAAAIADYDRALGLNPTSAEVLMRRASARVNWGVYKKTRGEDPGNLYAAAIADFDQALGLNPTSAEALMRRASARVNWGLYKRNRGEDPGELYAAAIGDFDRALGLNPTHAEALMKRALARVNWGVYKADRGEEPGKLYAAAIDDYNRALQLNPTFAEALMKRAGARVNWGVHKMNRGEDPGELYAAAIGDLDRALGLNPTYAEALMSRAGVRVNWGNYKQTLGEDPGELYAAAIDDCNRALGLNLTSAEVLMWRAGARVNWGVHKMNRGEDPGELYAAAIDDYDRVLGLNSTYAEALTSRASVQLNWGVYKMDQGEDPEELYAAAIDDYDRALGLNPISAEALMSRASARLNWGVHKKNRGEDPRNLYAAAIADFDRALGLNPEYADAYWRRGWCRADMKDWSGAAADFERAARLNPAAVPQFKAKWDEARRRLKEESKY